MPLITLIDVGAMMDEKLIKTLLLGNGFILEIYDQSRKIAGDRWLVKMVAKIDVPINRLNLDDDANKVSLSDLREAFGHCVRYAQQRERNFIENKQKNTVFNELMTSFLTVSMTYLSHPNFPARFAVREYLKKQQRNMWYRDGKQNE